jgi:hypothetical protein
MADVCGLYDCCWWLAIGRPACSSARGEKGSEINSEVRNAIAYLAYRKMETRSVRRHNDKE